MKRQRVVGGALRALSRLAGSETAERLGVREPAIRVVRTAARAGFRVAEEASARFRAGRKQLERAVRLPRESGGDGLFNLRLTPEQEMMRESVRAFAQDVLRASARDADDACVPPPEVMTGAWELGLAQLAVPEAFGGAGEIRSAVSSVLIAEDLAMGDMGLACAVLAPLGVIHALVEWGSAEQQSRYLPEFAGDEVVPASLALLEPGALFDPCLLSTRATATDAGYRLSGEKALVPLGRSAALWLVAAQLDGQPRIFIVERGALGATVTSEPSMGLRAADLCRLQLDDVRLPSDALLADADYSAVVDRGRIAWAAMAVGVGQAVLDYVIPYCNDRFAFGEPISHRQAVAFTIANIGVELESTRALVYRAAGRVDRDRDVGREACLAQRFAAEHGMGIGSDAVQLLGGHGYTKEHPVELWYRHLRAVGIMEGGLLV